MVGWCEKWVVIGKGMGAKEWIQKSERFSFSCTQFVAIFLQSRDLDSRVIEVDPLDGV